MTETMQDLLTKMRDGWTATVYSDDPRTRYYPPSRRPDECQVGTRHTVLALLRRRLIRIVRDTPEATTYAAAE